MYLSQGEALQNKGRCGFSVTEVLVAIVIIAVLTTTVITSMSKSNIKAHKETVTSELMSYSTGISEAYYDLGAPDFDPTTVDGKAAFSRFLMEMESKYLGCKFDYNSIQPTDKGFSVVIESPKDTYTGNYEMYFITVPELQKYVMMVSGGMDGIISKSSYSSGDYADDVVLITLPEY